MDCPLIEFAKISSGIAKVRDILAKFFLEKFLTNSSPYVLPDNCHDIVYSENCHDIVDSQL